MANTQGFYLTGDRSADELLATDPNALLIGMVLDQQVPMEIGVQRSRGDR